MASQAPPQSVAGLESLAETLYTDGDAGRRQSAESSLSYFTTTGNVVPLLGILRESCNQYALVYASQAVVVWFRSGQKRLSVEERVDYVVNHCGYALKRLAVLGLDGGTRAPRHVLSSLATAFARLTKVCYERGPTVPHPVELALSFARGEEWLKDKADPNGVGGPAARPEVAERLVELGLSLLHTLVTECSTYNSSKAQSYLLFAAHRRCSNNFRDESLPEIFSFALSALEQVTAQSPCVGLVVDLVRSCLTYDFMAIIVDETEEAMTAQFPVQWRVPLMSERNQSVLWGQHAALPYPHCGTLLQGISAMCGVRRTFFQSPEERQSFLNYVMQRLTEVTASNDNRLQVSQYQSTFVDCCYRLVVPFGYTDLSPLEAFGGWIQMLKSLTLEVLAKPLHQEEYSSITSTLLRVWSRLSGSKRTNTSSVYPLVVASPAGAGGGEPVPRRDIEDVIPGVVLAAVEGRAVPGSLLASRGGDGGVGGSGSAGGGAAVDTVDFMDESHIEVVASQCDTLGTLCLLDPRFTLGAIGGLLTQRVGPTILTSPRATGWMFFFVGSIIRYTLQNIDEAHVEVGATILAYAVECAGALQASIAPATGQPAFMGLFVERGVLHFLQNLQYVTGSLRGHPPLTEIIQKVFQERVRLFQFILSMVGHNIVRGADLNGESVMVVRAAIDLITEACNDVPKALLRELQLNLPPVAELPLSQSEMTYKLRTNLHTSLWALHVNKCTQYKPSVLADFLQGIEFAMQRTANGTDTSSSYIAGWLRDLRGVCRGVKDEQDPFSDFVDWFTEREEFFLNVLTLPSAQTPPVIVALMRLVTEVVTCGRYGRVNLPSATHSVSGVLLFKSICSIIHRVIKLCITEERIAMVSRGGVDGVYTLMMKPLFLCMEALKKCIHGGFVLFGAMWYYNDDTFDVTLLGLLRMLSVFPAQYFHQYAKVTRAVLDLLRSVTEEHVYLPFSKMTGEEFYTIITFAIMVCEDTQTEPLTLTSGLSFLQFVARLIHEVKAVVLTPALAASNPGGARLTPPPSPMQLPAYFTSSGVEGSGGRGAGSVAAAEENTSLPRIPRSMRQARQTLAGLLSPYGNDLWARLISMAMGIVVCQDRSLSACCNVVYPILEAHPPFWHSFVKDFTLTYPEGKQTAVREALSQLTNSSESQEQFFSEIFTFRQKMREL